jgi:hypothetical protein
VEPCFGTSRVSSGVPLATRGTGRGGGEGSSGGEGYTRTCVTLGVSEADRWIWEGIRARTAGRGERGAGKDREGVRRDKGSKAKGRAAARFGGRGPPKGPRATAERPCCTGLRCRKVLRYGCGATGFSRGQAKRSSDGRMPSNRGHLTRRGAQTYIWPRWPCSRWGRLVAPGAIRMEGCRWREGRGKGRVAVTRGRTRIPSHRAAGALKKRGGR